MDMAFSFVWKQNKTDSGMHQSLELADEKEYSKSDFEKQTFPFLIEALLSEPVHGTVPPAWLDATCLTVIKDTSLLQQQQSVFFSFT